MYQFWFRFSMVKMKNFVDHPSVMVFTLLYLYETKMQRIKERSTLSKNIDAHYRAMENIINVSKYKQ